jgi:hypothetical protein
MPSPYAQGHMAPHAYAGYPPPPAAPSAYAVSPQHQTDPSHPTVLAHTGQSAIPGMVGYTGGASL